MVTAVDDGVGHLLDKLDSLGIADDTFVVFLSDNGGPIGVNGSNNDPLRAGKGTQFEGGLRVPFAARWPGVFPAGEDYPLPVISLDIFATIAERAGVTLSLAKPLDGVDLVPFVTGADPRAPHDRLFWRAVHKETLATRAGDAKLMVGDEQGTAQLFDLGVDIGETTNVAASHPEELREARQQLNAWTSQLKDPAFPGLRSWKPKRLGTEIEE